MGLGSHPVGEKLSLSNFLPLKCLIPSFVWYLQQLAEWFANGAAYIKTKEGMAQFQQWYPF
jgi:hypothetical protein